MNDAALAFLDQANAESMTQARHEARMLAAVYHQLIAEKIPEDFARFLTAEWWRKPDCCGCEE